MISIIYLIGLVVEEIMNPKTKLLKKVLNLYKKYKEIINYLIVGVCTTVVSIVSYNLFRFVFENYLLCTVLSWIVSVIFAYITNRKFVFDSKEIKVFLEFIKFVGARILSLLSEIICMFIMVDLININDRISKIIVQFIIVVLNYVFSKIFVFRKKKDV